MADPGYIEVRITDTRPGSPQVNTDQQAVMVGTVAAALPTVTITSPAAGATVSSASMGVSGTYTHDPSLSASSVQARMGSGANVTMTLNPANKTWSGQLDVTGLSGTQTITATMRDTQNQTATATRNVTVSIPQPSNNVIGAVGDMMTSGPGTSPPAERAKVASLMAALDPVKAVLMGDLIYNFTGDTNSVTGNYDQTWGKFRDIHVPCPGNHETLSAYYSYYNRHLALANGSRFHAHDLPNGWRIYSLNFYLGSTPWQPGGEMYRWLDTQLQNNTSAKHIFFMHPPRHANCIDKDTTAERNEVNNRTNPIFDLGVQAKVDMFLSGHSHSYYRYGVRLGRNHTESSTGMFQLTNGMGGDNKDAYPGGCTSVSRTPETWPLTAKFDQDFGVTKFELLTDRAIVTHYSSKSWSGSGAPQAKDIRDGPVTWMSLKA